MKCNYCELHCEMPYSACKMYKEENGNIVEIHPGKYSSYHPVKVESIPIYHLMIDEQLLEVGGFNCNANCDYCINARVATIPSDDLYLFKLEPERIVDIALKSNCRGIQFGVNEVTVNLPSAIAVAKLAHEKGLICGASSNGYMAEESAELMANNFDYLNISLKSISDDYYEKYIGLPHVYPIKRNIKLLSKKIHIELTTPVVQGLNDHELYSIRDFIYDIDPEMAWHIFRLLPQYKMENQKNPDIEELTSIVMEIRKKLPFTYFSNFIGSQLDNSICPVCGEILLERLCISSCGAILLNSYMTEDYRCKKCGYKFPIAMISKGRSNR